MPGNFMELGDLLSAKSSYAGIAAEAQTRNAQNLERLQHAQNLEANTNRTNLLAPFEAKKAQFESSPEMRQAELRGKNAYAGLGEAQAMQIWQNIDAKKQDVILGDMLKGMQQVNDIGMVLESQGRGGADAYNMTKQFLQRQLDNAKDPQSKQRVQKSLEDFETYAQKNNLQQMTPQQLGEATLKVREQLNKLNPELIKQQLGDTSREKVANIQAASHERTAAMQRDAMLGKGVKPTIDSRALEVADRLLATKQISQEQYDQYVVDLFNQRYYRPDQGGIAPQIGAGGEVNLVNKGNAPKVNVPGKNPRKSLSEY